MFVLQHDGGCSQRLREDGHCLSLEGCRHSVRSAQSVLASLVPLPGAFHINSEKDRLTLNVTSLYGLLSRCISHAVIDHDMLYVFV